MRKTVKKQILELLSTLREAHREIRTYLQKQQNEKVQNILADCQDSAMLIGNTIEQFESDQEPIIRQLEEYCERLFVISNEMADFGKENSSNWKKELDERIENVCRDIENNIKVILKVVFFPYKASMWTSLESIWKAADEDEECEAKVVVIPYFALDQNCDKAEMKYEAELFPEYVPIVHYSDYDAAVEQPDMIFIHNPYDDMNNVTRVPEQYYSYNLKKYTEQLVYSPYGLMGYYDVEKGAFMCCTNAVMVADKILLQSEKVKRIYMDYGIDKSKLLSIGSPKVDAVVAGIKKPRLYPEGWEEKLQGRKVFLLNTHLSYFVRGHAFAMKHPKQYDSAKWYHEQIWQLLLNREGCALIWRPHPLLKETLESRGLYETLEFVKQLEQRIEASNNAVLDQNGEYDISFRLSDALITTYSSMISEYMISGKPIYIYQRRLNEEKCRKSPVSYLNNYYMARGGEVPQLPVFIQMVLRGEDPLYESRMEDVHRAFSNLEGTIGKEVYERLKRSALS